jgi:hypothetical protein
MTGGLRRMLVAALAASACALAAPAFAAAAPSNFVTMLSDPGDWVGGGGQRVFDPANSQMTVGGTAGYLTVNVSGGTAGDSYWMDFAAPPGTVLVPGVYVDAQRAPFREAGHPGIDISGDGRGCNEDSGLFQVLDIHSAPSGVVDRIWLIYEQHCEGGRAALYGEVKVGEPPSGDVALVAPGTVRWPASDAGRPSTAVPVTLRAFDAPVTVTGVSLGGADASSFEVREDDCTGHTLAASACQVWLRYRPGSAGTRTATLTISDSAGTHRQATLQGFAYGGQTSVTMTSDPGDYIGGGRNWSYTIANDAIGVGGTRQYVGFGVDGANGDWWYADFAPAAGDILAPGYYPNATRYPFNGNGPGLDVSGNGRGCNTLTGEFTVNSATWLADGHVRTFSVSFVQHCEGGTPALRGTFAFRAGDDTPLPPWMVGGPPPPPAPPPAPPPPPPPPAPPPPPPPKPRCSVPRVVGLTLAKAKAKIRKSHCRTGKLSRKVSVKRKRGKVLAQSPRAGRKLANGHRVNLVVGRGRRR